MESEALFRAHYQRKMRYGAWANREWVKYIEQKSGPPFGEIFASRAQDILGHILEAEITWYERITHGCILRTDLFDEDLNTVCNAWNDLIETRPLDEVITYQRHNGETKSKQLILLLSHVTNHGTYHRGQIRQLAGEYGLSRWPDTDLIYFPEMD